MCLARACRYDDYDYGEVNQLLERNMKVYIKTVACHPEKTTFRMYNNFWRQFRQSEKVHNWEGVCCFLHTSCFSRCIVCMSKTAKISAVLNDGYQNWLIRKQLN